MEKYHIYEEIGKGKFSQIFKGREKKNIEYVSIKRVDKNMMDKVVNEVQIIHRLDSPHTLKFHDWYETRNNLWLILEYCAGGDLASLIKQDGYLPETSVRMFSLDILAGLKYLHSMGLLHCDLRPSNILIDEYGILKISDFKYTRKIPKSSLHNQPMSSRGTPMHMAPELYSSEGVHSFASDFWSLGCVIFELRCGRHPFSSNDHSAKGDESEDELLNCAATDELEEDPTRKVALASLLERVRSRDPLTDMQQQTGSISPTLRDLVAWLLEKVPSFRCDWNQLCAHPFWGQQSPSCPRSLPSQAVYDQFLKSHFEGTIAMTHDGSVQDLVSTPVPLKPLEGEGVISTFRTSNQCLDDHVTHSVMEIDENGVVLGRQVGSEVSKPSSELVNDQLMQEGREQPVTLSDILTHISDSQVKPIVNNRAIETIEKHPLGKASTLHFQPLSLEQLTSLSTAKIESHLSQVYKSLQANLGLSGSHRNTGSSSTSSSSHSQSPGPTTLAERMSILSYLCSISSNTDAANTVLNTVFVNLLLSVLKSTSTGTGKISVNHTQSHSLKGHPSHSIKALAATALALFLRYATYVEPPRAPKDKDPPASLLAVLVTLLRDQTLARQDPLLRHRALAALGEIVFYISAQEEDGEEFTGSEEGSKWTLPLAAVTVLTKALSDESDEISRHYAAKTIENVLAQGGFLADQKFCTFEIAFRLLELSQHSRNTSIQATSAMALFHLFLTVCQRDLDTNSNNNAALTKKKGKSKPASEESIVSGAQFLARVLEKSGLVGFIDSLKDGRPRLQQAYLNIFNLIFSPQPLHVDHSKKTTPTKSRGDASLSKVRSYFIKAHVQLLPCLCRLAEQGSSAIVRAKAVLAVGLACQFHPEVTVVLCDHRFHLILMKMAEPVVASAKSYAENKVGPRLEIGGVFTHLQMAFGAQRISSSTPIYTGQCLLFLIQVLRVQLSGSLLHIIDEMGALSSQSDATSTSDLYNTPTKRNARSASPFSGNKGTQRGRNSPLVSMRTPDVSPGALSQDDRLSAIVSRADILKATISLCCHPSTRRLVVSAAFLDAVRCALSTPAFAAGPTQSSSRQTAEEALLLSLEFISQVEALGTESNNRSDIEIEPLMKSFIPAIVRFCGVCSGDSRVVVVGSLRRLFPPLIPLYVDEDGKLQDLLKSEVLWQLPLASLLADHPPVPQYTVRLLTEIMDASGLAADCIALLICGEESVRSAGNSRALQTLLFSALSGSDSVEPDASKGRENYFSGDAHVAQLLINVMRLRGTINTRVQMQLFHGGLTSTLLTLIGSACAQRNVTLLVPLLSLLAECLNFLKHSRSVFDLTLPSSTEEAASEITQIIVSLCSILPQILCILVWSHSVSEEAGLVEGNVNEIRAVSPDDIQQNCLNVFSLFLDLHPQHMISLLCKGSTDPDSDDSFGNVLATVLSQGLMEGRLLIKLLGLFLRFVKTTANLPTSSRVLRLLSSEPVYGALSECRRREWASFPAFSRLGSAREAVDAIHHLSSQLLALAAGGQARQL